MLSLVNSAALKAFSLPCYTAAALAVVLHGLSRRGEGQKTPWSSSSSRSCSAWLLTLLSDALRCIPMDLSDYVKAERGRGASLPAPLVCIQ